MSSNHPDFGFPTVLAVSNALWFPSFTFTNKYLLTCIKDITKCVANVIAVECCDASVVVWLWESGGGLGKSSTWIYRQVRQRFCRCPGNLSRTRKTLNPRFLSSRYSFQTSHYWHGFSLMTAPLTWNTFLACIPALHTRSLPNFQESSHDKLYKKFVHLMEHQH